MAALTFVRFCGTLTVAAALAACSSAGNEMPAAPTPASAQAPMTDGDAAQTPIRATLRIAIPRRTHRGHYVSPATKSIAIAIERKGKTTQHNFNLTPATNSKCSPSPLVCTITMLFKPGEYVLTFATFDGLLDATGKPTGHELSENQSVAAKIVPKRKNVIAVTLWGVPVSLALVPIGGSTLSGSIASGFTISKCFPPTRAGIVGIDIDGNFIVGPGAPRPGLTSSDSSRVAVAPPQPSSPNTFVLTRPSVSNAFSSLMLTATLTPGPGAGAPITSNVALRFNGDICGVFTEYAIPTNPADAVGIRRGSDGATWFTEITAGKIGRVTLAGTVTDYPVFGGEPHGIAAGPDGALWIAQESPYTISRVTTAGNVTGQYVTPTAHSKPYDITDGPDGALWFTEQSANNIGRITTTGTLTEFPIPTAGSIPSGITAGPGGNLWFLEQVGNKVARLHPGGGPILEYAIPTAFAIPQKIAPGPDGALWFTETFGNKIGRMTPAGAFYEYPLNTHSFPMDITAGPDGALWFTECGTSQLARITTTGAITEIPLVNVLPRDLTVGSDGAIWFTEGGHLAIGRMQ
jgi:virginiamycin B lyase